MNTCKLCNQEVDDGIHLSDGGLVHGECIESMERRSTNLQKRIVNLWRKCSELEMELARRQGLCFKLLSIFSKPQLDSSDIENAIVSLKNKSSEVSASLNVLRSRLSEVYDYYLSYPLDWEARRTAVAQIDGEKCSSCGDTPRNLHLHHRVPLSKGGSNKVSNLELLCEDCHSMEHGNRDFSGQFHHNETTFSKRLNNIRYAIEQNRRIEFLYKKPRESRYTIRTVAPIEIVNWAHEYDDGQTLCIRGYCELRKANRDFALKRMKRLRIL